MNPKASNRFPVGGIDVRLDVNKGIIEAVNIFGDFFGVGEVAVIEESLTGVQYDRQSMSEALTAIDIPTYLGGITKEEFLQLIY